MRAYKRNRNIGRSQSAQNRNIMSSMCCLHINVLFKNAFLNIIAVYIILGKEALGYINLEKGKVYKLCPNSFFFKWRPRWPIQVTNMSKFHELFALLIGTFLDDFSQ